MLTIPLGPLEITHAGDEWTVAVPFLDATQEYLQDAGLFNRGVTLLEAEFAPFVVNTDWAAENSDLLKGFLAAVATGWKDAVADPAAAVESLVSRNPAADAELETRRLELALDANVVTDWTKANGFGPIDDTRMQSALEQIKLTYEFQHEPDAALYFTGDYLPEGGFPLE